MSLIVSADIGGTNCRFSLFDYTTASDLNQKQSIWFKNEEVLSFEDALHSAIAEHFSLKPSDISGFVASVAGPVQDYKKSRLTNFVWDLDGDKISASCGIKNVWLINDFIAQAYACLTVVGENAELIWPGQASRFGAIAVLGAGTGFGKACLAPSGDARKYVVVASEGGHVNFCPETEEEFRFQEFVRRRLNARTVCWDRVMSGKGMSLIHEFLTGEKLSGREVTKRFTSDSPTLLWASKFYGRVCRNYALDTLATGGVFIAGGIAANNPLLITHQVFRESFTQSDTHTQLLSDIPVKLITNEESGLWGAARFGTEVLKS